ncbi:MAG TPA: sulfatase [Thermoanaerobaculia bacterium]|nr:sulfatase [Thermoanaerobaculia bacterium]
MSQAHRRRLAGRALVLAAGVATLALVAGCGGCRRAEVGHRGPIVLITLDALRADAVGAFGGPSRLTPALDALAREATWAGTAVAPSSWTVPSMASLFTGLQPWRNQNWHGDAAMLRPELVTIPEALQAQGFATAGFYSNVWLRPPFGYGAGFDELRHFREGKRAEATLAKLGTPAAGKAGKPQFVWAHILPPHAPYVRRDALLDRLPQPAPSLPRRVSVVDLEPWFDPAVLLAEEQADTFRAAYQLNVAFADQQLGRLLAALRRSGKWDETLLVVTSDHGEEFKECGQIEHGGNLCRALIEVPLLVKLPKAWSGPALALRRGDHPSTVRVRATLVEAAGGEAGEGTAPSLFHEERAGALSELYLGNGTNRISYVEDDRQLIWESRFAPPDLDYYRVHALDIGAVPAVAPKTSSEALHARLEEAFGRALPLSGRAGTPPTLTLWQWAPPPPGSPPMTSVRVPVHDSAAIDAMGRRLKAAWIAANGAEAPPVTRSGGCPQLTPEEEAELKALGYAATRRRDC